MIDSILLTIIAITNISLLVIISRFLLKFSQKTNMSPVVGQLMSFLTKPEPSTKSIFNTMQNNVDWGVLDKLFPKPSTESTEELMPTEEDKNSNEELVVEETATTPLSTQPPLQQQPQPPITIDPNSQLVQNIIQTMFGQNNKLQQANQRRRRTTNR